MSTQRKKVVAKKKKNYAKRGPTNKQLATRIKKLEHTEELKYSDNVIPGTWYGNLAPIPLCLLAQGDDFDQRVGEEIVAKYLNIKFVVSKSGTTDTLRARIMVFWDLQANGELPFMYTSDVGATASESVIDDSVVGYKLTAPLNYRTKQRFTILMDKVVVINPQSSSTEAMKYIKKNFVLGGAKVKYGSSSGTIDALPSRSLYVYGFIPTNNVFSSVAYTRLWYTDS